MVYVRDKNGHPLMPTGRYGKVRRLLKEGKAKPVKRCPFTIQLLYDTETPMQQLTLGVDAGSKHIGLSVSTESEELFAGEVELRTDIVKNLATRLEFRRARRNRKTRYRKPRFNNRAKAKHKGWLAPSVQAKIDTHLKVIEDVCSLLPVTEIVVETASFDLQKLKADMEGLSRPQGEDYRQGEQLGFWNAREYVLHRDGHICQCCKGRSKDNVLNVHHIESRKTGGDAPNNLVTLCETCHRRYHRGEITLPKDIKRKTSFRDASFMGIMRWALYDELKKRYPSVRMTYGYITKNTRICSGLEKSHMADARCIAGHPNARPAEETFYMHKVRRHNRQIHKATISKGGYRKRNQAAYVVKDFRLYDKVRFNGEECFIFGRRTSGSMDVRKIDGTRVSPCAGYKKLTLLEKPTGFITERRSGSSAQG